MTFVTTLVTVAIYRIFFMEATLLLEWPSVSIHHVALLGDAGYFCWDSAPFGSWGDITWPSPQFCSRGLGIFMLSILGGDRLSGGLDSILFYLSLWYHCLRITVYGCYMLRRMLQSKSVIIGVIVIRYLHCNGRHLYSYQTSSRGEALTQKTILPPGLMCPTWSQLQNGRNFVWPSTRHHISLIWNIINLSVLNACSRTGSRAGLVLGGWFGYVSYEIICFMLGIWFVLEFFFGVIRKQDIDFL